MSFINDLFPNAAKNPSKAVNIPMPSEGDFPNSIHQKTNWFKGINRTKDSFNLKGTKDV